MKNILAIIIFSFINLITFGQIPMNGLVTWYPMTSTTNGVVYDSSGNGNHATVDSALSVTGFDGQPNSAYQFDPLIVQPNNLIIEANNKMITMPAFGVTGNHSFSIGIWVKQRQFMPGGWLGASSNTWTPIIRMGNQTPNSSVAFTFKTGLFFPNYSCDAVNVVISVGLYVYSITLDDPYVGGYNWNQWHYICVTYKAPDPANGDTTRILKFYHNDSCVKTTSNYYGLGGLNLNPSINNYIGYSLYANYPQLANISMVGSVDNFFYYDRELTPTEVENIRLHPVLDTLTTSVNHNNPKDNNVIVYPNPNNGSFKVRSEYNDEQYVIYNSVGQMVYSGQIDGSTINLDVPNGFYFLKVTTHDDQVITKKIVINH